MYCRKCGKYIDSQDELCEECLHNELVFGDGQAQPQQDAKPRGANPRMLAFKPSLVAVITGTIGYVFMLAAFILAVNLAAGELGGLSPSYSYELGNVIYPTNVYVTDVEAVKTAAWILFVLGLPLCVLALVFGIRSLMTVVRAKKQGAPMAIAPLILSISAIALAGLAALFALMFLIAFTNI